MSLGSHLVVMLICENGSRLWDTSPLPSQGCLSALCDAAPTHLEEEPKANRDQGGSDSIAASLASSSTSRMASQGARRFWSAASALPALITQPLLRRWDLTWLVYGILSSIESCCASVKVDLILPQRAPLSSRARRKYRNLHLKHFDTAAMLYNPLR